MITVIYSQAHLRRILAETEGTSPTNMVMLPNGGILLMSLKPYEDTNGGYFISREDEHKGDSLMRRQEDIVSQLISTTTTQSSVIRKTTKSNNNVTDHMNSSVEMDMSTTTEFVYPEAWKDTMPKFGVIPSNDKTEVSSVYDEVTTTDLPKSNAITTELTKSSASTTEWEMPVFPFGSKKKPKTTTTIKSSTTKSTVFSGHKSELPSLLTQKKRLTAPLSLKYSQGSQSISKLFNNEIEVHKPKFKIKKPLERSQQPLQTLESTFIPISSNQTTSRRNLTDLYERLKSHYIQSQKNMNNTLKKRYRIDKDDRSKFDNVNVVVPGNRTFLASVHIVN